MSERVNVKKLKKLGRKVKNNNTLRNYMVITILTGGSRGDTEPYIALGSALKKAGYKVRIATFEKYEKSAKEYGLDFYPIKGDVSAVASSDDLQSAMKADNPIKVLFSFNKMRSYVYDLQEQYFEACQGSEVIIYHPGMPIGYFAAKKLGIPSIFAPPFPMTPTSDFPSLIFYKAPRLGKRFNLFSHRMLERIMWFASKAPLKQFWKKKFGKKPKNFTSPFKEQNSKDNPTIISCSQHVFPKPADWSDHVHITGYWFLEEKSDWKPPEELLSFLEKGNPPIYIGFGSIKDKSKAEETTRMVLDALQETGYRGIIALGEKGMVELDDLADNVFVLERAPHSWLFPKMAAVIHHGGAGTTAAGLHAGVPSIIIPYTNDQFAWGLRIEELAVGSKPIPRKKLSSKKLAQAINFALTEEIKQNAKELGKKISSENGAQIAAEIVGNLLK